MTVAVASVMGATESKPEGWMLLVTGHGPVLVGGIDDAVEGFGGPRAAPDVVDHDQFAAAGPGDGAGCGSLGLAQADRLGQRLEGEGAWVVKWDLPVPDGPASTRFLARPIPSKVWSQAGMRTRKRDQDSQAQSNWVRQGGDLRALVPVQLDPMRGSGAQSRYRRRRPSFQAAFTPGPPAGWCDRYR